ncbi:hypothetical protein F4780DRAFT_491901 [Xylariomycetidae sp. FL0641]|nr:hypothetical protein F4780DRAFT_491901 [Xylariomycetidae sp. FL0641]
MAGKAGQGSPGRSSLLEAPLANHHAPVCKGSLHAFRGHHLCFSVMMLSVLLVPLVFLNNLRGRGRHQSTWKLEKVVYDCISSKAGRRQSLAVWHRSPVHQMTSLRRVVTGLDSMCGYHSRWQRSRDEEGLVVRYFQLTSVWYSTFCLRRSESGKPSTGSQMRPRSGGAPSVSVSLSPQRGQSHWLFDDQPPSAYSLLHDHRKAGDEPRVRPAMF